MTNAGDGIKGKKSELSVMDVVLPPGSDEASTSRRFGGDSDPFYDFNEVTAYEKNQMKIGDHIVKHELCLKKLEKKPLDNYYEQRTREEQRGTKGKKDCKKRIRNKKPVFNLSDLALIVQQIETNDARLPTAGAESSTDWQEEEIKEEQIQYKMYNYLKMRESEDRKNQMQQRQAEENYKEELENLAETWLENMKRRNQLKQSPGSSRERPCTFHRMGCSLISRKCRSDDGGTHNEVSPKEKGERISPQKKEKQKEVKESEVARQQSSTNEKLGEEPLEKLVFAYDEDSAESS